MKCPSSVQALEALFSEENYLKRPEPLGLLGATSCLARIFELDIGCIAVEFGSSGSLDRTERIEWREESR